MEKYVSVSQYEGKEVVMFNLGQYAEEVLGKDSEEIPSSCLIGRLPEYMADLIQRHGANKVDLNTLSSFLRADYPETEESLNSRGF